MRTNCTNRRRAPSPLLLSSADAVAALRWSVGDGTGDAICVLLCSPGPTVFNAVVVDGAPPSGLARIIDLVLEGTAGLELDSLVAGVFRGAGGVVPTLDDLDAVAGATERCRDSGVRLHEVLLLSGRRWRSLTELAE